MYFLSAAPAAVDIEFSSFGFHYMVKVGHEQVSLVFASVDSSTGWPPGLLGVCERAISKPVWDDLCTDLFFVAFRRITAAATPNASGTLLSASSLLGRIAFVPLNQTSEVQIDGSADGARPPALLLRCFARPNKK